jgi:Skp family chaperone for outer membrane proteins
MKRPFAAALAALFFGSFGATALFSADEPIPTRLGFIDVKKVFDGYRKPKEIERSLKDKSDALGAKLQQRKDAITQEAQQLNTLNPGTPEHDALERRIQLAQDELEYDRKAQARSLQTEARRKELMIYREICNEAEACGAQKSLAAVFLHIPIDAEFERRDNLDLLMGTRTVLCRSDALDVTAEVIERLNASLPPASPPAGEDSKK